MPVKTFLKAIDALPHFSKKTHDPNLTYLPETIKDFGLNLKPAFQRDLVWGLEKKIALVESIFQRKKPNLHITFGKLPKGDYQLLDGQQRLNAILEFLDDKFPIFVGNKEINEGKGIYFSQLGKEVKRFLNNNSGIVFEYYDFANKKEMITYYISLNTSGVPHTEEEINKAKALLLTEE